MRNETTAAGTPYVLRPTIRAQWAPIIREKRHEWRYALLFIAGSLCGALAAFEVVS